MLAVYAAGYVRTQSAAELLDENAGSRRRPAPHADVIPASAVRTPEPIRVPVAPFADKKQLALAKSPAEMGSKQATGIPAPSPAAESLVPEPIAEPKAEAPPPPPPPPPAPVWKDGTYTGWGTSRHGDIQATVVIENGKIASATISMCLTRYSCSVIDTLPPQVAQRQSPETDYVSGATQSTNAFYYAVVEALGKAK